MSDGRVGNLGAIAREAFAVLAAILIAFALDAWWDGQVEKRDMREALDAVGAEIDRNIASLDSAVANNMGQASLIGEAMAMSASEVRALGDGDLARLADLPRYWFVTLRLGAATAFVQGGHLEVLENTQLRTEIAGLPNIQAEIDEEGSTVNDATRDLHNTLMRAVPVESMTLSIDRLESSRAMLLTVADDTSVRRALVSRTFLLNRIYGTELQIQGRYLARIREMIHAELGTTPASEPGEAS